MREGGRWIGGNEREGGMKREIRSRGGGGESGGIYLVGWLRFQKCVINYKRDELR